MNYRNRDSLQFQTLRITKDSIRHWKRRFDARRGLIASSLTGQILRDYYADDSKWFYKAYVDGETRAFPVFTRPEWVTTAQRPDDIIKSVDDTGVYDYDEGFLQRVALQKASLDIDESMAPIEVSARDRFWNDTIYRISDIHTNEDGGFSLDVGLTDYFSYVTHSTKLADEFYDKAQVNDVTVDTPPAKASAALNGKLSIRDTHANDFEAIQNYSYAHLLGALVTLVVKMPNGEYYVAVQNRSDNTVDYPDSKGVAPSGSFSVWYNPKLECNLTYHALREFGEEVFNREALRSPPTSANASEPANKSIPVRVLADLLADPDGGAYLLATGLGFEALTAASQLSMLLYIDDPVFSAWVYDFVEYQSKEMIEGDIEMVEVTDAAKSLLTDDWVPGAAFSLSQGLRTLTDEFSVDIGIDLTPQN